MKQKIFGVTVAKLTASFGQTIYMVGLSLFFGAILGILLALVLVLCRKGGSVPSSASCWRWCWCCAARAA